MIQRTTKRGFDYRFPGTELGVRLALIELRDSLVQLGVDCDDSGTVELVVAEVLNNVVEHALAGVQESQVDLSCRKSGTQLAFHVRDSGHPMPAGQIPDLGLPEVDRDLADLPEGGFGWALVRNLAQDLSYRREGDQNHLSFGLTTAAPAAIKG